MVLTVMFYVLMTILLIDCLLAVILGGIYIINYELKELTGTDFVRKWIERK